MLLSTATSRLNHLFCCMSFLALQTSSSSSPYRLQRHLQSTLSTVNALLSSRSIISNSSSRIIANNCIHSYSSRTQKHQLNSIHFNNVTTRSQSFYSTNSNSNNYYSRNMTIVDQAAKMSLNDQGMQCMFIRDLNIYYLVFKLTLIISSQDPLSTSVKSKVTTIPAKVPNPPPSKPPSKPSMPFQVVLVKSKFVNRSKKDFKKSRVLV